MIGTFEQFLAGLCLFIGFQCFSFIVKILADFISSNYPVEAVLALGAHADALIPPGQTPWCVAQGDLMRIQGDELPVFPEIKLKLPIHHHTQPECV